MTKENLLAMLPVLGFTKHGNTWSKSIHGAIMAVETAKEELIYPEDQGFTINERQTSNFSSLENFVVFECVHRLLEKGYHAKNIELKPKWKVGHGASGGRAISILHPLVKAPTEDGDVRLGNARGLPIDDTGATSVASASAASFNPLGGYGCRGGAG